MPPPPPPPPPTLPPPLPPPLGGVGGDGQNSVKNEKSLETTTLIVLKVDELGSISVSHRPTNLEVVKED